MVDKLDDLLLCFCKRFDIMIGGDNGLILKVMDYLRLVAAGQLFHGVDCLFAICSGSGSVNHG